MASIWKLLTLVAVLFMPLGMSSSQAAAPSHAPMAGMPMEHCPDQGSSHDGKSRMTECTMACAAALPAVEAQLDEQRIFASDIRSATIVETLHGLHPEIATPPPKHS